MACLQATNNFLNNFKDHFGVPIVGPVQMQKYSVLGIFNFVSICIIYGEIIL